MSHPDFIRPGFDANLAHFVEEIGEALSAAGKIQRFGALTANPLAPFEQREANVVWLLRELDDVEGAIRRLREAITIEYGGPIARGEFITPALQSTTLERTP